jgi:hypothetical protein
MQPPKADKPFVCPRCGAVLGQPSDNGGLLVGMCLLTSRAQVQCCHCGARRTWHPFTVTLLLHPIPSDTGAA